MFTNLEKTFLNHWLSSKINWFLCK